MVLLKLDISNKVAIRTDRIKCLDYHPLEPLLLSAHYDGQVIIWNWLNQSSVSKFSIGSSSGTAVGPEGMPGGLTDQGHSLPVRTAKFIARKNWFIAGSDDGCLRVYNYNTRAKVAAWDAHGDYIRAIAVHPTRPLVFSASDDLTIKVWDWERNWKQVGCLDGHVHYVMDLAISPKDPNILASASLDRSIKVWNIGAIVAWTGISWSVLSSWICEDETILGEAKRFLLRRICAGINLT